MNILIAEDDPISAMALRRVLEKGGYTVTTTVNGVDALESWQRGEYPIVITDWMMPLMDGLEICRRIRQSARSLYTCIIMLTAKQTQADRVQALSQGVDIFLTKPLIADDLIARIQVAERILLMEREPVA